MSRYKARGKSWEHKRRVQKGCSRRSRDFWVLSKLPKYFISRQTHSWSMNQLFCNIFSAINAAVDFKFHCSQSSSRHCLRDYLFFLTHMPVCNCSYLQAERERLITEVVLHNIQKGFRKKFWKTFNSPKKILLNEKILSGMIYTRHSWRRWQQRPTPLTSFLRYLLTKSKVFLFRLHCKTHDKRFIVYYLVMDALGRIAKLTRHRGF